MKIVWHAWIPMMSLLLLTLALILLIYWIQKISIQPGNLHLGLLYHFKLLTVLTIHSDRAFLFKAKSCNDLRTRCSDWREKNRAFLCKAKSCSDWREKRNQFASSFSLVNCKMADTANWNYESTAIMSECIFYRQCYYSRLYTIEGINTLKTIYTPTLKYVIFIKSYLLINYR